MSHNKSKSNFDFEARNFERSDQNYLARGHL